MSRDDAFDYILIGGGLQNGLIALALRHHQPGARIALIERDRVLGGNHTWSFHDSDVPDQARPFVAPLIEHRWPGYAVLFPGERRDLDLPYATFCSPRLDEVVRGRLGPADALLLGVSVEQASAHEVKLFDGRRLTGEVVIDARGPGVLPEVRAGGFLKFLGLEVRLAAPCGVDRPIIMDATVAQTDGFRFFYLLPFASDHVLIEDNYYSDHTRFDAAAVRAEVLAYAGRLGLRIAETLREESGVLPLPWRDLAAAPAGPDSPLIAGYQAGFFHPATSYSFPVALRLACLIGRTPRGELLPAYQAFAQEHRRQAAFCHRLNWLLFRGAPPIGRWRILRGFYRHPEETLQRFYALSLTSGDRFRILRKGAIYFMDAHLRRGA
jgi:lycopene beta-cyclase